MAATPSSGPAIAGGLPVSIPSPPSSSFATRPSQEERRLVTALFCDLVGFTPLSERLDPEEVRDIQSQYFEAMSGQVQRYGGTVEKYVGDAVLALFGAPAAHEDDAERAVLCALGMQAAIEPVAARARERWRVEPAIRVGVNTGEVVSGAWTASTRQDVAVIGDAINVASRLQSVAEAGEVLAGAETRQLTRRRIHYGERRDVNLKGKSGTIPVWPALGVREEFGERWEGYETPMVGRDREMVQLLDAWVRAQGGEGQLVTIVGDTGVGKSRLVAEFLGKITASGALRVLRARSLSYGQEVSLWLLADLLRSIFGIKEQDTLDDVAAKLGATIPTLLAEPDAAAEALDVLGEVLGLPPGASPVGQAGPQVRRQVLLRRLRGVLAAIAGRAPTVIVLEDLHWLDPASQEVLTEILGDVLGLRVLVVAAQRPGWIAPWTEWGWPERITLRPLREDEATELAGAVLGGIGLSPELEQYVSERAGGNPFFLEEILRALQDAGGMEAHEGRMALKHDAAERLPSTLTGVLLARLDGIDPDARTVAQVASVIGRTFPLKLLAEVVKEQAEILEESLNRLQRAEIAFPRRGPDVEYVFKHVSMRDAAYNTLVQKRRQDLHLRTAKAIASLYPADEYAEMIAYHFGQAGAAEAAEWLERAGDRASSIYANAAAIADYQGARTQLEAMGAPDTTLARLDEKRGTVLINMGRYDQALEVLENAAAVHEAHRGLEGAGRLVALIGMTHRYRRTTTEGIDRVTPVMDRLAASGPSEPLASLHLALASLHLLEGHYEKVLDAGEKAAEVARAIGNERQLGEAQERRGTALQILHRAGEGRAVIESALPLIERGGDQMILFRALNNAGEASKTEGDLESAKRYSERALEVAGLIGNPEQTGFILGNLAAIFTIEGEWERAATLLERAYRLAESEGSSGLENPLSAATRLALWQGEWEAAERLLDDAFAAAERMQDRELIEDFRSLLGELNILRGRPAEAVRVIQPEDAAPGSFLSWTLSTLAWALLEAGDVDQAARHAAEAVSQTRNTPLYRPDALRVQAMVWIAQGRRSESRSVVEEGIALAREIPYPYAEARLMVVRSQVLRTDRETRAARQELEDALAIFRRLGAKKDVERAEEGLAELS